jgi:hypothetical protein
MRVALARERRETAWMTARAYRTSGLAPDPG